MAAKTFKVKLIRSVLGRSKRQKDTVRGLGFTKLNQIKDLHDTPALRGMVKKVSHLVEIVGEGKSV